MITYGIGTYAGVMVVITGDIADVPAAVQSGLTAQGYTPDRAAALDNIDAPPSASDVAEAVRTRVKPDLTVINDGVKLASLGIPHSEDLEA